MGSPPVVFISSTSDDLNNHRKAAREAAISAHFYPLMMEDFAADGQRAPLELCLNKVREADVVIAIVAERYGWCPPDAAINGDIRKSITWLECECALESRKDLLIFVRDPDSAWPETGKEAYRLLEAAELGTLTQELSSEVQQNLRNLRLFKTWLDERRTRAKFSTPEALGSAITHALYEWRMENRPGVPVPAAAVSANVESYLKSLRDDCAYIDIRGLQVGRPEAQRIPIELIYMPLHVPAAAHGQRPGNPNKTGADVTAAGELSPLELVLQKQRVVVLGDPGSGKTTFLRRTAFLLCDELLGTRQNAAREKLGLKSKPFPILVRVAELATHIQNCLASKKPDAPSVPNLANWLPHYLGSVSIAQNLGLNIEAFQNLLLHHECLVLLDGLDEAQDMRARINISTLVKNLTAAYTKSWFVLTSRPPAWADRTVIPDFEVVTIEPLDEPTICTFLEKWSENLFVESPQKALQHRDELVDAFRSRPEIAKMARNPVMLTALAVLHWHQKKLPNQRAELYGSILGWLSKAREELRGVSADRSLRLLQTLAFAMMGSGDTRRIQVKRDWAAEQIMGGFRSLENAEALDAARQFLDDAELNSGIIVRRGSELRFWHLTFQEYLAGRYLAAQPDTVQHAALLRNKSRLYSSEWRETVLLFAGILHEQGLEKVDALYSEILNNLGDNAALPDRTRCAALLSTISRDLQPVDYRCDDPRYNQILQSMMDIFKVGSGCLSLAARVDAAEALGQVGDPRIDGSNYIDIAAGEFWMGAEPDDQNSVVFDPLAFANEKPPNKVAMESFRISRFCITVEEYARFVEAGGYCSKAFWDAGGFGKWKEPTQWLRQIDHRNRPVTGVSWFEAMAYASWAGCRLPTESEWEFAARGVKQRIFPWGKEAPGELRANFGGGLRGPVPVGLFPEGNTPEGVSDMGGNVWEWVRDAFRRYEPDSEPDRKKRVLRGGSWSCEARLLRCSERITAEPEARFSSWGPIGFRCVAL